MQTESMNVASNPYDASPSAGSAGEACGGFPEMGRYRCIRRAGEGGMAEVYLAHDDVLGRDVALKVLRRGGVDEQLVERFRREAKSAASLSHPNTVAIYDWGESEGGAYYLVMEYVPGGTLKDRIDREGPLKPDEAASVAIQTARALEAAHGRGMVHRDIKPQNILIGAAGDVKVTDFGIARAAKVPAMTEPGSIVGTVHYISPEQATGEPVGPASDLYSLGVVLYEMLTGQVPYDAEDPIAIVMKHLDGDLLPPRGINAGVPEKLNDITVKLLAREPEDRYADASALVEDLEHARNQENSTESPRPGPPQASPAPQKRRRSRLPLIAGLLGVLALVFVGLVLLLPGVYSWGEQVSLPVFGPETAEVPDVVGEPREVAAETLGSSGFEVRTDGRESSAEDEGMVVRQNPSGGELEVGEAVGIWVGQGPPPERDEELLRREVREYYGAVDRGEWGYTYSHLDAETQALFTEEEWSLRNQFLADNYPGELSSMRVAVTDITPDEPADVTVYRTFKSGGYNVRDTLFVYEDGTWKHRLTQDELANFRVDLSYEEFVDYYGG